MENTAHRRFAVPVVAGLHDALHIAQELKHYEIRSRLTSIVGREAGFSRSREKSNELSAIVNGKPQSLKFQTGSDAIVALVYGPDPPNAISWSIAAFEVSLSRWLIPAHARRLALAVATGEFLFLVRLARMEEERIATRALLHSCPDSVHDLVTEDDTKEFFPCAPKT
ncbi:hypothetical protein G5V57_15055 [Nordella sp. HKS 07]|uniref:hypothetical protein n=1 Tax=Nordella sp. HKS 07 TaxID=2712222 RepID=UPI0013E15E25|nr:hypothetical protein [Nordella sp. HKS 07]QIG48928.1 hypothetical protein G5V57_15055 [Nordella sp. HKS 07]